jgi:Na+-transporting NADH:ubiquinone oxidoreductase subunit B
MSKPKQLFMKQKNMNRMLYALVPVAVSAIYFFGWRVAAVLAVCTAAGLAAEYMTSRRRGAPISMACFVTCTLYALSLPVTVPLWIAAVGAVVGIIFGKEVFGGFGRNFVNPAILGRAFVYVCFPVDLTARFVPAFGGFPAGLAQWSFGGADAVSQASPMWVYREHGREVVEKAADWWHLMLGDISGTWEANGVTRALSAGSMGEGCAILIILTGVYLLVTKTANWRLMLGAMGGVVLTNLVLRSIFGPSVPPLYITLLAGTTMYVVVFMVTDPVSAPRKRPAQLAYGVLIGFLIVFLQWRGVFVVAATFAVLLGNLLGPLLDIAAEARASRKKASPAKEGSA